MKRVTGLAFVAIFLFSFVSAICEDGQVDINSASLDELDLLTGIGPAYAQRIIDARSFDSVDDLTKVKGIGEKTLEKIKAQGLACVSTGGQEIKETEEIDEVDEPKIKNIEIREESEVVLEENIVTENVINLNVGKKAVEDKVIYESKNEKVKKYAIYAFSIFLIIIIIFLMIDKNGTKNYSDDDY